MTSSHGRGLLHLAAAVDRPSGYDTAPYTDLVRLAESGGLDFVTLGDGDDRPRPGALPVLSRVAPETSRIGLVPAVTTSRAEPCHVQAAVATLDRVSRGRAGWRLASADARWREVSEVADAAARLWDGWEDEAEIREVYAGRLTART